MKLTTLSCATFVLISQVAANRFCQIPINMPPHPPSSTLYHHISITSAPSSSTPPPTSTTKVHTTYTYNTGPHETIAVGYPLCGIPGYTNVMGDYRESTHVQKGGNLKDCMKDCRNSGGACQSIAFHKRYTMCLWFDKEVQGTWLSVDKTSEFVHWDLGCNV